MDIKALIAQMTLEEKAAQTCMLRGVEYATKPSAKHNCSVEVDTDFDEEALREVSFPTLLALRIWIR